MLNTKLVSSMEKGFLDSPIEQFEALHTLSALRNERVFFQLFHTSDGDAPQRMMPQLRVSGSLSALVTARTVEQVPVVMPVYEGQTDDNYLRTTPGLYPDVLQPLHYGAGMSVRRTQVHAGWFELALDGQPAGEYPLTGELVDAQGTALASHTLTVEVLDAMLPPQELILTQWFHCDSLAHYYHCPVWSDRHWEVIENFARTAVRNGINLLLTPVFTPPLDTAVGGERLTCQLVDVTLCGSPETGTYTFGFDRLDRWVAMCDRVGVRYFEISHLFTQWGAAHAPKVMVRVDGEEKKLFGWDTDATGVAYVRFLRAFLTAFLAHMRKNGNDRRCFFHISDEPSGEQLESYRAAKAAVADLLEGYPVMDALSNVDFYRQGVVATPIPSNDHIDAFIEAGAQGLWTYYCCGQCLHVSNRLIAMPLWRTRSIGMQFFKYRIKGFLQWAYNFYQNCSSVNPINPFTDVSGEYWVPAGDTCSVYPAQDGSALESIRILSFYEALQDQRAMELAASLVGYDRVVAEMEKVFGEIRFSRCAHRARALQDVRDAVNRLIREHVKEA